jgi:rhodanese-related sulfurtransferase
MKKHVLVVLLMVVFPSLALAQRNAAAPPAAPASEIKTLTRDELDTLLKTPEKLLLIDVRRPGEVQANGGFPAYFSLQLADLEKYVAFIPKDRVIVAVSNHAHRAQEAGAVLKRHGFTIAGAVGAQTYEEEGGTILKTSAPPSQQAK